MRCCCIGALASALFLATGFSTDPEIGSLESPVRVSSIDVSKSYLRQLRTPEGSRLEFERLGSVDGKVAGQILDLWQATSKAGKTWRLYIDPHGAKTEALPDGAPPGLMTASRLATLEIARAGETEFINVNQPTGSKFTPITANFRGKLVVARVVGVGKDRDIQVLIESDKGWTPLGDRGVGLTGSSEGGNPFLSDMRVARDGSIYLAVKYTKPFRYFLYRYDGEGWAKLGPKGGEREAVASSVDEGLFWFEDNPQLFRLLVRRKEEGASIFGFQDGAWKETASSEILRKHTAGQLLWRGLARRSSDIWVLWNAENEKEGRVVLKAFQVFGPAGNDCRGPFELTVFDRKCYLLAAAVSQGVDTIAVQVFLKDDINDSGETPSHTHELRLFNSNSDFTEFEAVNPIEVPFSNMWHLNWSPAGILHAVRRLRPNGVELTRLNPDTGRLEVVETRKPAYEVPLLFRPELSFDPGGKPLVVWSDFWP